jgi:hypothetical protein
MENILANYKNFNAYNEVYEVVKTVEVVGYDRNTYRIEVLKCYSNPNIKYTVEYSTREDATIQPTYPLKDDKFERKPESIRIWKRADLPWVSMPTAEDALKQALIFLAEPARYPR